MQADGGSHTGEASGESPDPARGEDRIAALEERLAALAIEVQTRRLAVVDDAGRERVVAEVVDDNAELRVELGGAAGTAVVIVACRDSAGVGPTVGIQLWAEGDTVAALDAWPEGDNWRVSRHG